MQDATPRKRRRERAERPPNALGDRISPETSTRTRRVVLFLLGVWCGGVLLVSLAAPASFRAAEAVMAAPPEPAVRVIKELGPEVVRQLLRYQVAEVNRLFFGIWGWCQFIAGLAVFLLLLFRSNAGRIVVGISALMLALSTLLNFFLIPRISEITRGAQFSVAGRKGPGTDQFALLHAGFSAFQISLLVLIAVLLFLLFRRGAGKRSGDSAANGA